MRNGGESKATILLIAGPGGCGKSTLIGALRAGRLAESPLPESARFWPETSAKEMLRGDAPISARHGGNGLDPSGPGPSGLGPEGLGPEGLGPEGLGPEGLGPKGFIVHYDTMRVLTLGFEDHHDDPAIRLIAAAEGTLLAVTVACPREALFAQYLARAVVRNDGLADAQGGRARLKRRLWHLRAGAFGPPRVSLSRMQVDTLAIYGSDRELFRCYARWEASLDRLAAERGNVHRLTAVPDLSAGAAPSFRLTAAPPFETMLQESALHAGA